MIVLNVDSTQAKKKIVDLTLFNKFHKLFVCLPFNSELLPNSMGSSVANS